MGYNSDLIHSMQPVLATNSTETSLPNNVPTTTKPSGAGIITVPRGGGNSRVLVMPYGTDGDNETFNMRIEGWSSTPGATQLWIPTLLAYVTTVTLNSNMNGVSGVTPSDTEYLADTLTWDNGVKADDRDLHSPAAANGPVGWFWIKVNGSELIEFDFDRISAATCNALFRFF